MKLIHCADWHLDGAMRAHLSDADAALRREELRNAFAQMIEYAAAEDVRAVLICGDLFDSEPILPSTERFVLTRIRAHPEMHFYYLRGNHDAGGFSAEALPENLHLFSAEGRSYRQEEVVITGIEQPNAPIRLADVPGIQIVMMHGMLAEAPGKEQIPRGWVQNRGADYLALGHLHSYRTEPLDARGIACMCGCPAGRGFDECGEKGFVLLETENGRLRHRFVPLAGRRMQSLSVDITGAQTVPEVEKRLSDALQSVDPGDMVRVALTGVCEEPCEEMLGFWQQQYEDHFFYFHLTDESRYRPPVAEYVGEQSLRGAFVRTVLRADLEPKERERVLFLGLHALAGDLPREGRQRQ